MKNEIIPIQSFDMLLATSPNLVGRDCQKHKRRYPRAYGNLIACIWKMLEVLYIHFNHLETSPIWEKDLFSLKTLLYINLLNMLQRKPQGASQYIFKTIQKWKKVRNTTEFVFPYTFVQRMEQSLFESSTIMSGYGDVYMFCCVLGQAVKALQGAYF